ncbi:MAG: hypothetical protein U0892_04325 [Pirellulales bacterium]
MYGDFSRNPFSHPSAVLETGVRKDNDQKSSRIGRKAHITRVLFNQGQPCVEADMNEALNAVLARSKYRGVFEYDGNYCTDATGLTFKDGTLITPLGAIEIGCPLHVPTTDITQDGIYLTVSEHPLSLAFLSGRLADERLVHASEIWGMRLHAARNRAQDLAKIKLHAKCDSNKASSLPMHSIIRIEVHSVPLDPSKVAEAKKADSSAGNSVEVGNLVFKLDLHNAGYANAICKGDGNTISLGRNSCFVRNISPDEIIEIQEPTSDNFIAYPDSKRSLHVIESVDDRQVHLRSTTPPPAWKEGHQCRFWLEKLECDPQKPQPQSITFSQSGITLTFENPTNAFQPGMVWLVNSDELRTASKQAAPNDSVCAVSELHERPYFKHFNPRACQQPAPAAVAPAPPPGPAPAAPPPVCSHPSSLNWHDLPCGALAVDANSAAVRRWLASMTLGELAGLDHEQVRARLTRDCNIRLEADPALESEILKLIARRDQYLGASYSQLA